MLTLQVRYLSGDLPELRFIDGKSDWVDLYAAETVTLSAGEYRLIPLGVAIALPDGYEAHVVPRSSTFRNYGVLQANSVGVIDNSYRGDGDEWFFPAYATRNVTIQKGARICQFRVVERQPALRFQAVEHLPGDNRGGFGSTGI